MTLTYPKAHKLTVGYDPKQDRLFLISHLQDGGFRKVFLSRRMLGALLVRMSEELASSHPMAGYTAHRDEMLQMEHVASVSVQAADSNPDQGQANGQAPPTEFQGSFYVTDAHVELH